MCLTIHFGMGAEKSVICAGVNATKDSTGGNQQLLPRGATHSRRHAELRLKFKTGEVKIPPVPQAVTTAAFPR